MRVPIQFDKKVLCSIVREILGVRLVWRSVRIQLMMATHQTGCGGSEAAAGGFCHCCAVVVMVDAAVITFQQTNVDHTIVIDHIWLIFVILGYSCLLFILLYLIM